MKQLRNLGLALAWLPAIAIGLPCLFFSSLGFTGNLMDTSPQENTHAGFVLVGIAAVAFGPVALCYLIRDAENSN